MSYAVLRISTCHAELIRAILLVAFVFFLPKLYFSNGYENHLRLLTKHLVVFFMNIFSGHEDQSQRRSERHSFKIENSESDANLECFSTPPHLQCRPNSRVQQMQRFVKDVRNILVVNIILCSVFSLMVAKMLMWRSFTVSVRDYVRFDEEVLYRGYQPPGSSVKQCYQGFTNIQLNSFLNKSSSLIKCTRFREHGPVITALLTGIVFLKSDISKHRCIPLIRSNSSLIIKTMPLSQRHGDSLAIVNSSIDYVHPMDFIQSSCSNHRKNCSNVREAVTNDRGETIIRMENHNRQLVISSSGYSRPGITVLTDVVHTYNTMWPRPDFKLITKRALAAHLSMQLSTCFKTGHVVESPLARVQYLSVNLVVFVLFIGLECVLAKTLLKGANEVPQNSVDEENLDDENRTEETYGKTEATIDQLLSSIIMN